MDVKNHLGIDYSFDVASQCITWKQADEMNYTIRLFFFGQDNDLVRGVCQYRGFKSNKDLLIASGKTEQEANDVVTEVPIVEFKGRTFITVADPAQVTLTAEDIKKFMNNIAEKHLGFIAYDESGTIIP